MEAKLLSWKSMAEEGKLAKARLPPPATPFPGAFPQVPSVPHCTKKGTTQWRPSMRSVEYWYAAFFTPWDAFKHLVSGLFRDLFVV